MVELRLGDLGTGATQDTAAQKSRMAPVRVPVTAPMAIPAGPPSRPIRLPTARPVAVPTGPESIDFLTLIAPWASRASTPVAYSVMSPAACQARRAFSPASAAVSLSKTATENLFLGNPFQMG